MKPGGGAQKKISSFFISKPKPSSQLDGPSAQAGSTAAVARTAPKRPAPSQADVQPAAKRQATDASAATVPIPVRDVTRAAKAQRKLAGEQLDPTLPLSQAAQQTPGSSKKGADKGAKLTPLEQQVVDLKQKHPDVLMVIEVGYKFRAFGEDAEVCARVCNIYAFPDHNFLTCSFPVFRLPVYVRRLVNAGHKVGVVRQVETAAIKSQSASRNLPFERKLTGLYTAATLDAGQKADKAGEEGSLEEFAELDAASMNAGAKPKYVLFVSQLPVESHTEVCEILSSDDDVDNEVPQPPADSAATSSRTPTTTTATAPGRSTTTRSSRPSTQPTTSRAARVSRGNGGNGIQPPELAFLAVEPSTGDVQLGLATATPQRTPSTSGSGGAALELEGVLLSVAPIEVVVLEPVSAAVARMCQAYVSSTPGCRTERLRGWGSACTPDRLTSHLAALYPGAPERLAAAQALPSHAQRALAAASSYLGEFGLEGVMRPPAQLAVHTQGPDDQHTPDHVSHVHHVIAAGLRPLAAHKCMALGPNALRQLEVLTSSTGGHQGSLIHLLDRTSTAAGGRLLRSWVTGPLTDAALINARLDAVEELAGVKSTRSSAGPLSRVPDTLRRLPDLERGLTRLLHRTAPPSELVATLTALKEVPHHLGLQYDPSSGDLQVLDPSWIASPLLTSLITAAAAPEAHHACVRMLSMLDVPAAKANRTADCLTDPELFADVAAAKAEVQAAHAALQGLLPGLAKQLGFRGLEYVSIQNQGDWLIEVPVEQVSKVPRDWSKVCGTKKVNRYHPPSVQDGILALAIAKETLAATAAAAYTRLLTHFAQHYQVCKAAAQALAQLDTLSSLAAVARTPGYCRPCVNPAQQPSLSPATTATPLTTPATAANAISTATTVSQDNTNQSQHQQQQQHDHLQQQHQQPQPARLIIKGGRHPMLDAQLSGGGGGGVGAAGGATGGSTGAVPNDVTLDGERVRAAIITGPNMGGKSCLIRQAALIAIMAQVGSFVPADSCHMSVLDGVYTRMGASDNLLLGRSTFMEELSDAAHILSHATHNSLVIMDELGRGTATHDGVAIATATLSHLVTHIRCLSLFVTHYPEISQLCDSHAGHVRAYHMAYIQQNQDEEGEGHQGGDARDARDAMATTVPSSTVRSVTCTADMEVDCQGLATGGDAPSAGADGSAGGASGATDGSGAQDAGVITTITFLYKLRQGQADQSFGLNVARMAGLPVSVVRRAAAKASELQSASSDMTVLNLLRGVVAQLRLCLSNKDTGAQASSSSLQSDRAQLSAAHAEVLKAVAAIGHAPTSS